MSKNNEISGVKLFSLETKANRIILHRDLDNLMRRIGQVEVRKFSERGANQFMLRAVADEVWVPIEGGVDIILVDRRPGSPTEDTAFKVGINAGDEEGVLVPFGVAYSIIAKPDALLLRLSTHRDGSHEKDQLLSAASLSKLITDL